MKFISEKAASKATPHRVIDYVLDEEKVCKNENGDVLMATIGLDDDRDYAKQFRETALLYGNSYGADERKYYHTKYTVSPRDYNPEKGIRKITPEQLLEEATQFCHKYLPGYQSIIVIQYHDNSKSDKNLDPSAGRWTDERHPNEEHLHAHIITNACPYDLEMGMLRIRNKDLDKMRDYAYEAGKKYHLNERYWRDEVAEKRARQKAEREKKKAASNEAEGINLSDGELVIIDRHGAAFATKSFKERYRIAIDEARREVTSFEMFAAYLNEEFSIKVQVTRQGNIKYKFPDRTTYTSGKVLGEDYTLGAIMTSLERSRESHKNDFEAPEEDILESEDELELSHEAIEWKIKITDELGRYHRWNEKMRAQDPAWDDAKRDPAAKQNRDRLILEKTAELYRLYQEAIVKEDRKKALAEEEKEYLEATMAFLETLKLEEEERKKRAKEIFDSLYRNRKRYYRPYDTVKYNALGFKRSILGLMFLLIKVTLENEFGAKNPPEYNYAETPIYAKTNWKIQRMADAVRIARELGANSQAELEIKIAEEGRKYGKIKRDYFAIRRESERAVAEAIKTIDEDKTLTAEERERMIEWVRIKEQRKMAGIEESFLTAKKWYAECARAGDTVRAQNARVIYRTEIEKRDSGNTAEFFPSVPQQDKPRRSKEEAKRQEENLFQELRDWSDMAIEAISKNPDTGEIGNLQEWAAEMEKHGCIVRITKETISVKHPDRGNPVRLNRLGGAYEKENILNGIHSTKQEYREQVEADRRREADERRAAEERAYGAAIRRAAESLEDDRAAGQDDSRAETAKRSTAEGKDRADRASRSPEEVFGGR